MRRGIYVFLGVIFAVMASNLALAQSTTSTVAGSPEGVTAATPEIDALTLHEDIKALKRQIEELADYPDVLRREGVEISSRVDFHKEVLNWGFIIGGIVVAVCGSFVGLAAIFSGGAAVWNFNISKNAKAYEDRAEEALKNIKQSMLEAEAILDQWHNALEMAEKRVNVRLSGDLNVGVIKVARKIVHNPVGNSELRAEAIFASEQKDWETATDLWRRVRLRLPKNSAHLREAKLMYARAAFQLAGLEKGSPEEECRLIEGSVAAYKELLPEVSRDETPDDWAIVQHELGQALTKQAEWKSGKWCFEEAIGAYREALEVKTRENHAVEWAQTQNRLGFALTRIGQRDLDRNRLTTAIKAQRLALSVITQMESPQKWAHYQRNLGMALNALACSLRGANAVDVYNEALEAYRSSLEASAGDEREQSGWAATLNNMGIVLWHLGRRHNETSRLKEAEEVLRLALTVRTREALPLGWAMTQCNLADVIRSIGKRENNPARIEEAVSLCRSALGERTRNRKPDDWASAQGNLGISLISLAEMKHEGWRVDEAISSLRMCVEERSRETAPQRWAVATNDLGRGLTLLGVRENSIGTLEEAISLCRAAADVAARDTAPTDWGRIQINLGKALHSLAILSKSPTHLEEARGAFEKALDLFDDGTAPYYRDIAQKGLNGLM